MDITSAYHSALSGVHKGLEGIDRSAAKLASAEQMSEHPSPARPLLDGTIYQRHVEANVAMLRTVDETIGFLIDEMA